MGFGLNSLGTPSIRCRAALLRFGLFSIQAAVLLACPLSLRADAVSITPGWPRFNGPDNSGRGQDATFDLRKDPNVRWQYEVDPSYSFEPFILNNKVVIYTEPSVPESRIEVLDLKSGDLVQQVNRPFGGRTYDPQTQTMVGGLGLDEDETHMSPRQLQANGDELMFRVTSGVSTYTKFGITSYWTYNLKEKKLVRAFYMKKSALDWQLQPDCSAGLGYSWISLVDAAKGGEANFPLPGVLESYASSESPGACYYIQLIGNYSEYLANGVWQGAFGFYAYSMGGWGPGVYDSARITPETGFANIRDGRNPGDPNDYDTDYWESVGLGGAEYTRYENQHIEGEYAQSPCLAIDSDGNTLVVAEDSNGMGAFIRPKDEWQWQLSNEWNWGNTSYQDQIAGVDEYGDLVQRDAKTGKVTARKFGKVLKADGSSDGYYDSQPWVTGNFMLIYHYVPREGRDELVKVIECIGQPDSGYPEQGHQGLGPGLVNTATGNKLITIEDLHVPGRGLSLTLNRTYNSSMPLPPTGYGLQSFGNGWSFNYAIRLTQTGSSVVTELRGDGRFLHFAAPEPLSVSAQAITFTSPEGVLDTLTRRDDGKFELRERSGIVYVFNGLPGLNSGAGAATTNLSSGHLIEINDPNQNKLTFSYFGHGGLQTIVDSTGRQVNFESDATMIHAFTDPLGRRTQFNNSFGDGNLVSVDGPGGYHAAYTYDLQLGNRLTVLDDPRAPKGHRRETYSYHPLSYRLIEVKNTDSPSVKVKYEYNDDPDVLKNDSPVLLFAGNFPFDKKDYFGVRITDAMGNESYDQYDGGNLYKHYDALYYYGSMDRQINKGVTEYRWNNRGLHTKVIDAKERETEYTYDERGNLTDVKDPLQNAKGQNRTTHYEYDDKFNNVTLMRDVLGHETKYTYQANKPNLTSVKDALDHETQYTYDDHGQKMTSKDANEKTTTFTYDSNGNLDSVKDPLDHTRYFTYDGMSRKVTEKDARGNPSCYAYDDRDRLVTSTNPDNTASHLEYDSYNNVVASKDPKLNATTFVYNQTYPGRDLLEQVVEAPNARTTLYTYDLNGNRTKVTDANGHATDYEFNELNQLKKVTDAENGLLEYKYDLVGNLTEVKAPNSNTTTYTYDELNRVIRQVDSLGTMKHTYDDVGNRLTTVDQADKVSTFTYDAVYRLTRAQHVKFGMETAWVEYDYDPVGNPIHMRDRWHSDNQGSTFSQLVSTYDAANQLIEQDVPLLSGGTDNFKKHFLYDEDGRRKEIKVTGTDFDPKTPGGQDLVWRYTYDTRGRMSALKDGNDQVLASYGYDSASNLTATAYQNFVNSSYGYDEGNRLTSINHYSYLLAAHTTNPLSFPSTLASFTYFYDQMNHRSSAVEGQGGVIYEYDKIYRLKKVTYPNTGPLGSTQRQHTQDYTYDAAGNRQTYIQRFESETDSYSYSYHTGTNQMYQSTPPPGNQSLYYYYDAVGNMTRNNGRYMHYDAANQLIDSDNVESTASALQFKYSGDGQRIHKQLGSVSTVLIMDGLNTLAEIDDTSNVPVATYAYGADGLVLKDHYFPMHANWPYPIPSHLAAERSFYHRNGLGSVALTTDVEGKALERFDYDPFGLVLGGTSSRNKHTFTGKEFEDNIDLYYFNARWMDAGMGRFTQVDPMVGEVTNSQDWNQFAYVRNDPINNLDPTGRSLLGEGIYFLLLSPVGESDSPGQRIQGAQSLEERVNGAKARYKDANPHLEGKAQDWWTMAEYYGSTVKVGGSPAWRNNNPGNLRANEGSMAHYRGGKSESASSFLKFDTEAEGIAALMLMLEENQCTLPMDYIANVHSPASDGNNLGLYKKILLKYGVDVKKPISEQYENMKAGIMHAEGWDWAGEVVPR